MEKDTALDKIALSKKIDSTDKRIVRGVIFSDFNHKALNDLITYNIGKMGCFPEFYDEVYSNYFPHILGNMDAISDFNAHFHVYIIDGTFIEDGIGCARSADVIREKITEYKDRLEYVLNFSTQTCKAHTFINTIHISEVVLKQYTALNKRAEIKSLLNDFNAFIQSKSHIGSHITVIDIQEFNTAGGSAEDGKLAQLLGLSVGLGTLDDMARSISSTLRMTMGKTIKCVVTDLDNTLWKGTLADDGIDNIIISDKQVGTGFLRYQRFLSSLYDQGIILAICSKNNLENVEAVFQRRRNELQISLDKFSVISANWDEKSTNIVKIAKELNISIEHMMFIDDSGYECAEVKTRCPEITVVDFSGDVAENVSWIIARDYFQRETISNDDRLRNLTYSQNKIRTEMRKNYADNNDFLASLNMTLSIRRIDDATFDRVSQLTLRTNQFNMTTRRMSMNDVAEFNRNSDNLIVTLNCHDNIGDYGTIGAMFLRFSNERCYVDNFIMSCRIFGRQVEFAAIQWLFDLCKQKSINIIEAAFIPTEKNKKFRSFYHDCGFNNTKDTIFNIVGQDNYHLAGKSHSVAIQEEIVI
ncbi:HAD-IIIC family phosphatase [Brenneria uluponensis]|uniref:HAD-IIIC family phosphatase n=1 Tax=Brenneria uluponensis TaxID=3057057 RepID=UPI0028E60F66|nr:HAD-IIIC family phosphatase [Brenneria ulupoensis]